MADSDHASRDIEGLVAVSSALARAPTNTAVVDAVLAAGLATLEANSGIVVLASHERQILRLIGFAGEYHSSYAFTELPIDDAFPIARAIRTGNIECVESLADFHARYPRFAHTPLRGDPIHALACTPMIIDGTVIGAIGFAFGGLRKLDERDKRFLVVLAQQCALALERARLHDVEIAARAAELLRDEYLARVSHELRTPLSAMRMWIQVLRSGRQEDRRVAIDAIDKSAISQFKLIEDLLDFARGVNGKLRITDQLFDARVPIENAVSAMRPDAEAKAILLLTAIASDAGYVCGDPGRIEQVVMNLLGNAIKFTPRGGRIEVLLRAENQDVVLSVSDTGQGIDDASLEAVFAPFHQRERPGETQGGLGLGLTIARHLVELHHGSIAARSGGEGAGATFIVKLPRIAEEDVPPTPSQVARKAENRAPILNGLPILVIEDHEPSRDALARMLEGVGAHVIAVATTRDAERHIERGPLAVIVSDIALPEEDGCAFLQRLRARGATPPAIALTAYARPEDVARSLAAGFQVHMAKPVDSRDIVDNIARLAGRAVSPGPRDKNKTLRVPRR